MFYHVPYQLPLSLISYASDVTSGLSDGYEGLSEKSAEGAQKRTGGKLFRRRTRSRLRITGVSVLISQIVKN